MGTPPEERKLVHNIAGSAIGPLGWGTTAYGHSTLCRFLADKVLHELEQQQQRLNDCADAFHSVFVENGMAKDSQAELRLTRKNDLTVSEDQVAALSSSECWSRDNWFIGLAIIESKTRALVVA